MKQIFYKGGLLLHLLVLAAGLNELTGQANCVLEAPVLHIDFGNSKRFVDLNLSSLGNYNRIEDDCPQDGSLTTVPFTRDCYSGHWITVLQDHTPNDNEGNMLLVNSSYRPGLFFVLPLNGLPPNTTYELAAWLMNICKSGYDCSQLRPNLRFLVENAAGKELARFTTGELPAADGSWLQYSAFFRTPADGGTILLKIENKEIGGCGNDFAMDDITIRKCIEPKPAIKTDRSPKPEEKKLPPPVKAPVFKENPTVLKPIKKAIPVISKTTAADTPVITRQVIKQRPEISLPKLILTRSNPIIKQIETRSAEILVDLYDNGEIDGDTVSIYHNNELLVSRAALSEKPVSFRIPVDSRHPYHELVMVANNLGSIPPNTSLMIVTAIDKRYEIFISSSEQKNAKVVIELKNQ